MEASARTRAPIGLGARLARELGAKTAVWLGLAVGICVPYFAIQQLAWLPPRELPATLLDRAVPFAPGWIHAYASVALLVPLAPALAATRDELVRYARGLAALCLPSFLVFLLFPVLGPRPEAAVDVSLYTAIVAVDRPTNSLPSLHAGLTVYSLLYIDRVFGAGFAPPARALVAAGSLVWAGLILYSTLATRQHGLLDLPPGALMAFAAHSFAWWGAGEGAAAGRRSA